MTHLINFTIGDWSCDGHNMSEKFTVSSNKSRDELRVVHLACKNLFGFTPSEVCEEFEKNTLTEKQLASLLKHNISLEDITVIDDDGDAEGLGADEMLKLWLRMLIAVDPSLELTVLSDKLPTMHGHANGVYIGAPGYGCFTP